MKGGISKEDRERRRQEIERNRLEREKRRMNNLILQRERFFRSMRLLQLSERREEGESEAYEDYTMHLYRQTAPEWNERCKKLEHKLFYSVSTPAQLTTLTDSQAHRLTILISPNGLKPGLNLIARNINLDLD